MNKLYTPWSLWEDVVREGSRRFDALEPPRTSVRAPCTPCFFCEDVVREGSVESNHSETMWKKLTQVAPLYPRPRDPSAES